MEHMHLLTIGGVDMRRWNMMGWRGPNPYPFCRCNPMMPSRRFVTGYFPGGANNYMTSEMEYLKNAAEDLKNQLEQVNKRIKEIEKEEDED